ncbi:hypothetical protein JCM10213_007003 [Rhodosporidiobolus nylandii]
MSLRDPDAPLRVRVVVYDLLPPSRLASLLNFLGTGVHHSSVELCIPLGPSDTDNPTKHEYAYGGHDQPGLTGVFSIPAGTAAQRMSGLRYYMTVDMGDAFGEDWVREFKPKPERAEKEGLSRRSSRASAAAKGKGTADEADETIAGPPYGGWASFSRSTTALAAEDPFDDLASAHAGRQGEDIAHTGPEDEDGFVELDEDGADSDDGGASDGTEYMTKAERRAWRIVQEMKRDEAWEGPRYKLLENNCNSFTHELVYRLTGRRAPAWLNRAAWVATSIPCIVPAGWIDEADEAAPSGEPSSSSASSPTASAHIPDPAHALSSSGGVTIAPPRADKMALGRSRA